MKKLSKYTTQLNSLIAANYDLGMKDYPIFDENYRAALNLKIINHYKFREIGFETADLFKHFLNMTLSEIMPYYNQLYKSTLLTFNPLYSVDYTQSSTKQTTGTAANTMTDTISETNNTSTSNNSTDAANNKKVESDTPQGLLAMADIEGNVYATNADIETDNNTHTESGTHNNTISSTKNGSSNNNINNLDAYTNHVTGNNGNKNNSELLNDFRSTFINIDVMIINELNTLFMGIW